MRVRVRVRVRVRAVKNSGLGPLRLAGAQAQAPQDPAGGRPKAPLSGPIPRAGPIEPGMRTSGPALFNAMPAGRLLISRPSGPVLRLVLNHDSDSRCHAGWLFLIRVAISTVILWHSEYAAQPKLARSSTLTSDACANSTRQAAAQRTCTHSA